ncbi:MAG: serpin family protein [Deltaproteobacteria bacterium]|nr:serpin family protein [Deltaproteobacteria bacterium]
MKSARLHRSLLASALAVVTAACGNSSSDKDAEPVIPEAARSQLARNTSPQVLPADAEALVAGNTAFGADLLKRVGGTENAMISPYSISLAIAMTWAGARTQTEQAIAQTMHFSLPQERLHPAINQLDLALAGRGQNAQGKDGKPFRLKIANAAWGERTFDFVPSYLDTLATSYGAGVNLMDVLQAAEAARVTINDWVAYQTEDRIQDLLPQGSVTSATRLVLTNAVYFNAAWKTKFEQNATRDAPFTLADGNPVSVSTMFGEVAGRYAEGADFIAAELPYDGSEVAMTLVMPKAVSLAAFEAGLDGARLQAIVGALADESLLIQLPKFQFEGKASLAEALSALGMEVAFSDAADFSGIHAAGGLSISDVIHQTFVAVDEAGTEAAAATGVVVGTTSVPVGRQVQVDRPFLFLIRDVQTGAVLFLGHVYDPR